MATSPSTSAWLYSIECDPLYNNLRNFESSTDRASYFNSITPAYSFTNLQYIRKNGSVDIPVLFDLVRNVNYILYDNAEGNGTEFAFVERKEFINFNVTRFYLKYDVWMNNCISINSATLKGIVTRRHFDPTTFSNTIHDGPADACCHVKTYTPSPNNKFTIVLVTYKAVQPSSPTRVWFRHQKYDKMNVIFFPFLADGTPGVSGSSSFESVISACSSPWVLNSYLIYGNLSYTGTLKSFKLAAGDVDGEGILTDELKGLEVTLSDFRDAITHDFEYTIDDLTGDDKKIYSNPYTCFMLTDGANNIPIKIDHAIMSSNKITIKARYVIDSSGIYVRYILPYNTITESYNALYTNSICQIPRYTSSISEYLSNNGFSALASALISSGSVVAGVMMDSPMMITAGITGGVSQGGQLADKYAQPPIIRDDGSIGSLSAKNPKFNVPVICRFEMFDDDKNIFLHKWLTTGYPTLEIGTIELRRRKYYDYIKTEKIDLSCVKDNDDREILEDVFNRGVTLWHFINTLNYKAFNDYVSNSVNEEI